MSKLILTPSIPEVVAVQHDDGGEQQLIDRDEARHDAQEHADEER